MNVNPADQWAQQPGVSQPGMPFQPQDQAPQPGGPYAPQPGMPYQPDQTGMPFQPQPDQTGMYPPQPGMAPQPGGPYQPDQTMYAPQPGAPGGPYQPQPGGPYQPQAPYPGQPQFGQPPAAPPAKAKWKLPAIIGGAVVVVLVVVLVIVFATKNTPEPTPPPASTTEASQSTEPTESGSSSAAAPAPAPGDAGLVTSGDTFTDDAMGTTITIGRVGTNWLPALPSTGDPTLDEYNVRMIGIELSTDLTNAIYMSSDISGYEFTIDGQAGAHVSCQDLYSSHPEQTTAILSAISGGDPTAQPYDGDLYGSQSGSGWIVCFTGTYNDASFSNGTITISYDRDAGLDQDENVIPSFHHQTVVTA